MTMTEKLLSFFVQYARLNLWTTLIIAYALPQAALEFAAFRGRADMVETMLLWPRYHSEVADSVRLGILYGQEECVRVLLGHAGGVNRGEKTLWAQDALAAENQNIRMLIYKSIYNL